MATFRFRAQVALDFRRRQKEAAERALGEARHAVREAGARLADAEARHADALDRARRAASGGSEEPTEWHRNWIIFRRREIARGRQALAAREAAERETAAAAMEAHRRVRSLERLKERSFAAFEVVARRDEQKGFDELGNRQYVARRTVPGER